LILVLFLALGCEQPVNTPEKVPETPENPVNPNNPETPENPEPSKTIKGIAVASLPDLTYYAKNQTFDSAGLTVVYQYTDGTESEPLETSAYTVAAVDTSSPGSKRVSVRSGAYSAVYFTIYVDPLDRILRSLEMTSPPAKTTYALGENFSMDGLVISGTYSDGAVESMDKTLVSIRGYDKRKRGAQTIVLGLNQTSFEVPVTVKVPSHAVVSLNPYFRTNTNHETAFYKQVYIKGNSFEFAKSNLKATVEVNGVKVELSVKDGTILEEDVQAFSLSHAGVQTFTLTLDDATVESEIYVADIEPAVYFDYGYLRQASDLNGNGPGDGKYYAQPNETLVLAPVRVLIGFDGDHKDLGASYAWSVSGGAYDNTAETNQETFAFTPKAAGTYTVTVSVTGRNYVTGQSITKTASTEVVCYTGTLTQGSFTSPLKNFACGQMSEGGTGHGWSLGSVGGYEVWKVEPQASYTITGNPFGTWSEAGVVWVMEDKNGNQVPDELWYELKGSDDDPGSKYTSLITRRYSITYFRSTDTETVNEYGQIIRRVYWVDSKGRTGILPGGWPKDWGVTGDWATYTGTLLRDNGNIATGNYEGLGEVGGYVDAFGFSKWTGDAWNKFSVADAIRADGSAANLNAVKFIKVQTAIHHYGGIFGDCSTEINNADFLGSQTDFPNPDGGH
jgi:hypothetical protein